MLLAMHSDACTLQDPQRGKGVEDVVVAESMPAATEDPDVHAACVGCDQALDDGGIDIFGVLNVERVSSFIDELSHERARIGSAPEQADLRIGMKRHVLPVGLKSCGNLRHLSRIGGND